MVGTINNLDHTPVTLGLDETDMFLAADSVGTAYSATGAQIRTFTNSGIVDATAATLAVTAATHGGRTVTLNRAGGIAVTLPAAAGTGEIYRFFVGTTFTSDGTIAVNGTPGTDIIQGAIIAATDTSGITVPTAADSDTITLNGSTTGGVKGSYIQLIDVASGLYSVTGALVCTGVEATPFSAAVS